METKRGKMKMSTRIKKKRLSTSLEEKGVKEYKSKQ